MAAQHEWERDALAVINAVQWIDVMFHFHICPVSHRNRIKLNGFGWFASYVWATLLFGQNLHCNHRRISVTGSEMVMVWWAKRELVFFFSLLFLCCLHFVCDGSNRKRRQRLLIMFVCRAFSMRTECCRCMQIPQSTFQPSRLNTVNNRGNKARNQRW